MTAFHGLLTRRNGDTRPVTEDEMVAQAACVLMHRQHARSHPISVTEAVEQLYVIADTTGVDDLDLAHLIITASEHRARCG